MKKLFFAIAALAVMTGCNNDELVEVTPKQAIAFGNAFVDNATRAIDPSITSTSINSFNVYGTVQGTGTNEGKVNIFNGITVTKGNDTTNPTYAEGWSYESKYTQYWIVGNAYNFKAIVNGTPSKVDGFNMPLAIGYEANATNDKDLLYAETNVDDYTKSTGSDVVKFTFNHLLSKVHFTFKNTITDNTSKNDGVERIYAYRVTDMKITNAYKKGTYDITQSKWDIDKPVSRGEVSFGDATGSTNQQDIHTAIPIGDYGNAASRTSRYEKLLVPATYKDMIITCKIETLLNGVVIDTENLTINPANDITLQAGHAYNFIIEKGAPGEVIMFSVKQVNTWDPAGGTDTEIN